MERGESRNRYQGQETGSLSGYSIRLQYQAAESGSRLRLREKKRNGEGTRSEDRYRSLAAVRRRWPAGREASRKRSAPAQYPSKGKEKRGLIGMPRACERVERIPAPEGLNRWSTSPKRQPLRSESQDPCRRRALRRRHTTTPRTRHVSTGCKSSALLTPDAVTF